MLRVLVLFAFVVVADEEYAFWDAAGRGDVAEMTSLLDSGGIDLEYHDDDGRTPLLLTVLGSHTEAAAFLVGRGANVESVGRWPGPQDGPLAVAAGRGDLSMMDALVTAGAAPGAASGPDGRTPLMMAAAQGETEAVRFLLGVGAGVDATRGDGTTAAFWAARQGHVEALEVLLDHGASVTLRDELDGSTLLHFAAQAGGDVTRLVLRSGGDRYARSNVLAPKDSEAPKREELKGGMTPLMSAASTAAVDSIEALLDSANKDYVNAVDAAGYTALAWACAVPNGPRTVEALDMLTAAGARDDSLSVDGRSLLHVAAEGRNARALAWLVDVKKHAVDLPSPGKGHTPLLIAAFQGSRASAKALLRRGADVNAAAPDGATPLIAAASAAHKPIVKLLLKKGADPLRQLKSGEFPSQVTPKTPHGKMLKWSLSKAERKAWRRLDHMYAAAEKPPEQEEGVDDATVEDLDDEEESQEEEEEASSLDDEL